MLTLSHLLATSLEWRGASVTVRMIVRDPGGAEEARQNLSALIKIARIDAEVEIIVDDRPAPEVISLTSRTADIAFLGLPTPDESDIAGFADVLDSLILETESIPAVAFVLASKSADLELILQSLRSGPRRYLTAKASFMLAWYWVTLPSLTRAVMFCTSTPVMPLTDSDALATPRWMASSKLTSEIPMTSMIFTTPCSMKSDMGIFLSIRILKARCLRGE